MDSKAHLALMAKAQKVFASDDGDSFLAFPVTPVVYDRGDLDFSMTGSADEIRSKRANIEAFSLLVNLLPEGNAWVPSESRFLWDEYGHVLSQGTCASSTRTPDEETRYQAARDFLKDRDADGVESDSPQVIRYKQYQDAWYSVREEFDEARFSNVGEFSDDEAARRQWREVTEPAFRGRLATVEREWVLEGFKNEVETKQNELIALGAKSPLATWLDWKANFDPSIDAQTGDSTQLEVFPTSFSPTNALDEGNWKSFELDSATIEALVAQAPADLKKRFNVSSEKTRIASMNLEFSMAVLNRHWFNRDVLHSRFWRLSDQSKILSDGESPAEGDCPGYVTGVVFARHVNVHEKSQNSSGGHSDGRPSTRPVTRPRPGPIASPIPPLQLQFSQLAAGRSLATRIDPDLLQTTQPIRVMPSRVARPRSGSRGVRMSAPVSATLSRPAVAARPITLARPHNQQVPSRPQVVPARINTPPALQLQPNAVAMKHLARQRRFTRLDIAKPVAGTGVRPPPPPKSNPDEIQILAFICKRVPKCPDPDMSLTW